MLSNGFDKPLHLRRKPSKLLAVYLIVLHGLALIVLLQSLAITLLIHTILSACLLASVAYHVFYFRRQSDDRDYWIWQAGGVWRHGADEQSYRLFSADTVQTAWFVLLTVINLENRKRTLLFVRDQVDADTFRRLRVRLKLHHDEATASREESV